MEFEEDFKIFIKRRTANKDKDCQAEAILTSLLGYSVLADLSQFNVITDSAERWRNKIERINSHWAPYLPDERTRLEHLFRSCTDEFKFRKMYLQIKEYQQTVELIKIPEMVLSENTLRQIITGAQLYADKHFESRKRTFNVFQDLYWDPKQISNCNSSITGRVSTLTSSLGGDYTAPASSDEEAE